MNIGEILWELKYITKFSQAELARQLDCSQVTVSRLTRNRCKPTYNTVCNILNLAKKYKIKINITADDLMYKGKEK